MNDPWYNNIVNEDFDADYENVMNCVEEQINYQASEGASTSMGGGNYGGTDDGNDDSNDDDSNDDESNDEDSDTENEMEFCRRRLEKEKLIICTAGAISLYYINYMYKEPCMVSYNTGMRWLTELLNGHWKRCVNMFRMDANTLTSLCLDLETQYGLKPSSRMPVIEKLAMFVFTIAVGASNRQVQERFQHSGETISRCINEVLEAVCLLAMDVIKPTDPDFMSIPSEIATNQRHMPHFKNCVGAIDGTHVRACVSAENQVPFIGRKGKYYLVDAGYPNEYGYLGPYKGHRYHFQEFRRRAQPSGREEVFNRAHSSLRNVIERSFGVWKQRWQILQNMPAYPYKTQVKIVVASMALHNYIRRRSQDDITFAEYDRNPNFVPEDILPDVVPRSNSQRSQTRSRMDLVRDGIASSLMRE
ncbi:protein ALP [Salix suchowensis]|nr:protein ALP [Salix suchowensis]